MHAAGTCAAKAVCNSECSVELCKMLLVMSVELLSRDETCTFA